MEIKKHTAIIVLILRENKLSSTFNKAMDCCPFNVGLNFDVVEKMFKLFEFRVA
jgi:hypothetical protein